MIQLINISKRYGDKLLYDNASLTLTVADKVGLIGSNGSGKTTLINIIAREISPDSGHVSVSKGFRLGILEQEFKFDAEKTVVEEVKSSIFRYEKDIDDLNCAISKEKDARKLERLLRIYAELEHSFEMRGGYELEAKCKKVLSGLGFSEDMMRRKCNCFSGGQLMRISLAKLLVAPLDGMLLDEPTNHLDLPSLLWFEEYLKTYPGMIVMISHDRTLLNSVVKKIVEVHARKLTVYDGNYDSFTIQKAKRMEKLDGAHKRLQKQREKTQRFIERFRYKNTKSRQVQSRIKNLEKMDIPETLKEEKHIDFHFPQPQHSGYEVIRLQGIRKSYGDTTVLDNCGLSVKRGEKIAITGKNGTGKSTLLKIMANELKPDEGCKKYGVNVTVGYFSQIHIEQLNRSNTIMDEMEKVRGSHSPTDVRKLLGQFFFTGDDVFKSIGLLSGGEKSRVLLARLMLSPANFLLMDEPTNHLDIPTQRVLIDALSEYSGTLCLVSHDRYLINAIATRLLYFDDNGITDYPGNLERFRQCQEQTIEHETGDKQVNANNRKSQKRKDAEERNYRYKKRKEYDHKIDLLEKTLENLMNEESELTEKLADTNTYKNQESIKPITERYNRVKNEINRLTEQWEELALEREKWL